MAAFLLSLTGMKAQQVSEIYEELPNPVATDASKWARVTNPIIAWGSTEGIAGIGNSGWHHEPHWMDGREAFGSIRDFY